MVSETSIAVYSAIVLEGITSKQELRILKALINVRKPKTRKEIAVLLGLDPGSCAGRCNKLMKMGFLIEGDNRKCKVSGRNVGTVFFNHFNIRRITF